MILPNLHYKLLYRPRLIRYSVSIISVILALLLTLLLQPWFKEAIFSPFFAAVAFSAWYGGLETGLFATIVSVLASNYFLIPIADPFPLRNGANVLHLILFSIVALLVSSLNAELRTARRRAETNLAELQLSEERYRRIVDTAYEGIWLINADLRTEYANQRLTEILGYSLEELYDRGFYDLMAPETQVEAQKILGRSHRGDRQRFDGCFRSSNGSERWAIVSTTPILTAQNKFNGVLVMLTDITERKQAELERTQLLIREQTARAEAETANRTKDEFLAVLSHELRAPLSPILGWAKLLQSQKLDPPTTQRAVEIIERSARLQTQLIEDLLDVSRIVQGKLSLQFCPVNLISVIESAVETVHLVAAEKAINLRFSTLDAQWENLAQSPESFSLIHAHHTISAQKFYVSGDPNRLQQVIWNLLSNAIKFTPKQGQINIQVSIIDRQSDSEFAEQNLQLTASRFVQVQVKDTGKGIHPDFLPYVFESFRQADSTITRTFGGLGLGLAIVRHLVELHGGTVKAESLGENQGATFTIALPLLDSESGDSNASTLSPFSTPSGASLSGKKILLVEDEQATREFLTFALEQNGAIVTAIASANQAFQVLQQVEQHLLISDIGMPDIDGYTLMRQIRSHESEKTRNIAAIALTAYVSEADQQESRLAGFQCHLLKPVEPAELISAIVNVIT